MSLSLSSSYSEKAREKVNKRHDLLLDKKLRDLEKIRQTVEREMSFEQKAVRAELKHQRRPDHRLAGARRGSCVTEVKDPKFQLTVSNNGRKREGRRCSLPVNLLPVINSVTSDTDSGLLTSIDESEDGTNRLSRSPPPKATGTTRRRSLQPISPGEFNVDSFKSKDL